ncbi:MAG: hypothetical protein RIF33_15620 [Cyclobacteriaceae bacterium]
MTEVHVEAAKIQNDIIDFLGLKNDELMFEYAPHEGNTKLDLITINPRHNQSFLFRSEVGIDKVDALKKVMYYLQHHREKEGSYTVQWMTNGVTGLQTSYFRAKNIYDALDKLYYGRDMNTITVFSVVLNPIA